jgi:hypothetical protein
VRDALSAQKNSVFAQYRQHGQRFFDVVSLYLEMLDHRLKLQANTADSSCVSSPTTVIEAMAAQHIDSIHNMISQSMHVMADFDELNVQVSFSNANRCNFTSPVWLDPHWINEVGVICKSTTIQKPDEQSTSISAYLRKELLEIQFLLKPAFSVAQFGVSRLLVCLFTFSRRIFIISTFTFVFCFFFFSQFEPVLMETVCCTRCRSVCGASKTRIKSCDWRCNVSSALAMLS